MTEIAASAVLTPGETPFAVVIRPKTTQGWRPISVKIQPNELPKTAGTGSAQRQPAEPAARWARAPCG